MFHTAPFFCFYGERCQFAHIKTDFSDFTAEKSRYTMLMHENTQIMKSRIEKAADPDVTVFNAAMPSKARLPIFEEIYSSEKKKAKKAKKNKNRRASGMTACTST